MQIIHLNSSSQGPENLEPCVMAIGFFDGMHLGHQQLIKEAKEVAKKEKLNVSVMTFYPHPKKVLKHPEAPANYLTPVHSKTEILSDIGIDTLYIVEFDIHLASISPSEFIERYIVHLKALHVVVGFDFTFGYKGKGNAETLLQNNGPDFKVTVVDKVTRKGHKISSTLIRNLISFGHVDQVPKYLGDYYEVAVTVNNIEVDQKSNLLVSDVTLTDKEFLLPRSGEYLVEIVVNHEVITGMIKSFKHSNNMKIYLFKNIPININDKMKIKWLQRAWESNDVLIREKLKLNS